MFKLNLVDDTIHKHLEINTDNVDAFVKVLKEHSHLEAEYHRAYAMAQKKVDHLQFEIEFILATIVEELKEGKEGKKPVPASGWGELRRVDALLDPRYSKLRIALIEATEELNILKGFVEALRSRGYRLLDIAKIQEQLMQPGLRVYENQLDNAGSVLNTE